MKKVYLLISILAISFSCKDEGDVGPAKEITFIRYLGTENNNVAVLAKEVTDGGTPAITMLSYSEIAGSVVGQVFFQTKLIHTDASGNFLWSANYPQQVVDGGAEPFNIRAASFIQLSGGGYLIIGDRIYSNGTTDIQLVLTDANGQNPVYNVIEDVSPSISLRGHAVMEDQDGDIVILGKITGDPENDMFMAKIALATLSATFDSKVPENFVWLRRYPAAGLSTLINRVYKNTNNFFWGGYVLNSTFQKNDVRLIRAPENSDLVIVGNPIGDPEIDENAVDFCQTIEGWGVTGATTAEDANGDLYVMKITNNSTVVFQTIIPGVEGQRDAGVSIDETEDHGFVVLGESGTTNRRDDLTVAKVNASGVLVWSRQYGTSDRQQGASIRVTADGSLLVFGTTYFNNEKKLMLMRLKGDGTL